MVYFWNGIMVYFWVNINNNAFPFYFFVNGLRELRNMSN